MYGDFELNVNELFNMTHHWRDVTASCRSLKETDHHFSCFDLAFFLETPFIRRQSGQHIKSSGQQIIQVLVSRFKIYFLIRLKRIQNFGLVKYIQIL